VNRARGFSSGQVAFLQAASVNDMGNNLPSGGKTDLVPHFVPRYLARCKRTPLD
jgi:hypothetical protein